MIWSEKIQLRLGLRRLICSTAADQKSFSIPIVMIQLVSIVLTWFVMYKCPSCDVFIIIYIVEYFIHMNGYCPLNNIGFRTPCSRRWSAREYFYFYRVLKQVFLSCTTWSHGCIFRLVQLWTSHFSAKLLALCTLEFVKGKVVWGCVRITYMSVIIITIGRNSTWIMITWYIFKIEPIRVAIIHTPDNF